MPELNSEQHRDALARFIGTEVWYRHPLNRNITYTEGVQFFAEKAGAYWLLDILVTEPDILKTAAEFAAITLDVKDGEATLIVTDGNENETFQRHLPFTNCPEGDWKFYMYNNVILLTSEY